MVVRPLVDPRVLDLAKLFMSDYAIRADTADAASDAFADATWDLADSIQQSVEGWLEGEVSNGRLVAASHGEQES